MSDRLRQAAQALVERWDTPLWKDAPHTGVFIAELRAALAEPQAEPVAWMITNPTHGLAPSLRWKPPTGWHASWVATPLFAAPQPARAVPPLTDAEMLGMSIEHFGTGLPGVMYQAYVEFARAVEAEVRRQFGVEGE